MAGNRPARERFDFSLDARQVAAVILGSLAALGVAFFLGHALGQRVADQRPAAVARAPAAPAPADPLAVLDQAPRPDRGEVQAQLSFHEALTSARPPQDRLPPGPRIPPPPAEAKQAQAATAQAAQPGVSPPSVGARPTSPPPAAAGVNPGAPPAGAPDAAPDPKAVPAQKAAAGPDPKAAPPQKAVAAATTPVPSAVPSPKPPSPASRGAWVVQVGSTQDRVEADRIAARFATRGARVVVAEVPGKGRWYRVRVGSFDSRETADRYLKELERGTGAKGFVAPAN
jgi:cell division septation protein DedD